MKKILHALAAASRAAMAAFNQHRRHILVEVAGLGAVGAGVWQMHPPSALIVVGVATVVAVEVRQ